MSNDACDVLVAGGGPVGASLAAALATLPLRIAVVEARETAGAGHSHDDRTTAVADGSRRILDTLGIWRRLAPEAIPIRRIHVSDRGRLGVTRLDHSEHGVDALGYVVENRRLASALAEHLAQCPNVTLLAPARVVSVSCSPDVATAEIEIGGARRTLSSRLLAAADGAHSTVRAMLGITAREQDYGQTAIVANVTPQRFHDHVAYERFTDGGPLAFLPASNGRCSVVWTVWSDAASEIVALDDETFLARLQAQFGYRLGRLLEVGRRGAWPLSLVTAHEQTRVRLVLLGNAAHGLHPVAGQGFNLGLRDIAALAETVADALGTGADPGSDPVLARYRAWREEDQRRVVMLTDGVVRLFTSPFLPFRAARGAGLVALDLFPPGKSLLAQHAMGLGGRLPRLALGRPLP